LSGDGESEQASGGREQGGFNIDHHGKVADRGYGVSGVPQNTGMVIAVEVTKTDQGRKNGQWGTVAEQ
jgi:hypothetical protein